MANEKVKNYVLMPAIVKMEQLVNRTVPCYNDLIIMDLVPKFKFSNKYYQWINEP